MPKLWKESEEHVQSRAIDSAIGKYFDTVKVDLDSYQLSMPLLASAYNNNKELYEKIKAVFLSSLNINPEHSVQKILDTLRSNQKPKVGAKPISEFIYKQCWFLGRLLIAESRLYPESELAGKIAAVCAEALKGKAETAAEMMFHSWSYGYLATYYAKHADCKEKYIQEMLMSVNNFAGKSAESELGKDDVLWAIVLGINAAAVAGDQTVYDQLKALMSIITQKDTVTEALSFIPATESGFRAWALSIVQLAAGVIKDQGTVDQIREVLPHAIDTETETEMGKVLAKVFMPVQLEPNSALKPSI